MNKKAAIFLSSIITIIIAGNYIFFSDDGLIRENVKILRVLDGDTVELEDGRRIRILNINTPEKGLSYSELGKNYLSSFEDVELENAGNDIYGRILGRLYSGKEYLNLEIVKRGYAHSYLVDDSEKRIFEAIEDYARENELAIWEKSEYYGCLKVEINKYEEYLDIEDSCNINFIGWSIKDESTKSYEFERDVESSFRVYSGKGTDNSRTLYWGKEKVWNNDGDRIFVRDSNGFLAYYSSYK